MERKYQVFISSTFEDLVDERQEVVQAILRANHIPAGMELFKGGRPQEEIIEEWIQSSDLYILLLGARYGSLRPEGDMSYTEWEFRKAMEMKIPHVVIALDEKYINSKYDAQSSQLGNPKFQEFRNYVFSKELVGKVSSKDQIIGEVSVQLNDLIRHNKDKLVGWVRGDLVDEFESAKEEISNLKTQLNESNERIIQKSNEIISMQRQEGNESKTTNIPKEVIDLVGKLTQPKETDDFLREEMKWITDFIISFSKENQSSAGNPNNRLSSGSDGTFGLVSLTLGENQIEFRADYQEVMIFVSQFIQNSDRQLQYEPLDKYKLESNGKLISRSGSILNEETLVQWIQYFFESIARINHIS